MIRRLFFISLALGLAPLLHSASPAITPVNTEIEANRLVSTQNEKEGTMTTVFEGNVVVVGTDIRMTCDKLVVISTRKGDKDKLVSDHNQFKSLVATGHVTITQGPRTATCGRAEVFPEEEVITLTENPIVEDREYNAINQGDVMRLRRGQREVEVEHPRIKLPPIKDLGFDKNAKPAATPAKK